MSTNLKEKRPRRPAARRTDIVLALMEDRLDIIASGLPVIDVMHVNRMREFLDELKRSLGKKEEAGEGE